MPKRTWSEDEIDRLKELYGTMTNEEILQRHFPDKSKASLKWQVERWKLGTKDYWSEKELRILRTLVEHNLPIKVIAEILNRTPQSIAVKTSLGGITREKRDVHADEREKQGKARCEKLDALTVGGISELRATAMFLENGFDVYSPFQNNHAIDRLVVSGNIAIRIQIKTAIYDTRTKRYRLPISSHSARNSARLRYSELSTDLVVVVCPGLDDFYIIPVAVVAATPFANFYPARQKQTHEGQDFEQYRNSFGLIDAALKSATNGFVSVAQSSESPATTQSHSLSRNWQNWSEREETILRVLSDYGVSTRLIASVLKRSTNAVKTHLGRLEESPSEVPIIGIPQGNNRKPQDYRLDAKLTGSVTESLVIGTLAVNGFDVFIPCAPNRRIDAGILHSSHFARLQIKRATFDKAQDLFRCEFSTKNVVTGKRRYYDPKEVDFFIVNCGYFDDLYVIPADEACQKAKMMFFPHRHRISHRTEDEEEYRNRYDYLSTWFEQRSVSP